MTACLVLAWVFTWKQAVGAKFMCAYMTIPHSFSLFCVTKVKHVVLSTWMGDHLEIASAIFILNLFSPLCF